MTNAPGTILGREPTMVLALIQALIVCGVTFGLRLTPEQTGAILTLSAITLGLITRSQVTPTSAPVLDTGTKVTTSDGDAAVVRPS